jgi:hypothetical protein
MVVESESEEEEEEGEGQEERGVEVIAGGKHSEGGMQEVGVTAAQLLLLAPPPSAASSVGHNLSRQGSTAKSKSQIACHQIHMARCTRQLQPRAIICIHPAKIMMGL